MFTVLYDYQHFTEQKFGGITRYHAGLINEIDSRVDVNRDLAALYTQNHYLQHLHLPLDNALGRRLFTKYKRNIRWNRAYAAQCISRNKHDLLHPTYYHPYFLKANKKPLVITIHDMIHERYPEAFSSKHDPPVATYKKLVTERADKIIAVSESTKQDIIRFLNVPDAKIEVIHHGVSLDNVLQKTHQLDIPERFILYVGNRNSYKNFGRCAQALANVMQQDPDLFVICAGGQPFSKEEVAMLTELKIIHRVIRFNVTDDELAELYQRALMLVYPSLWEGFGLPVLEAFQYGCPVVCSNAGSLPEVAGGAVLYIDPMDTASIENGIMKVLSDADLRKRLIAAGQQRVKQFPLQATLDKTIDLYKSLV